MPRMKKVKRLEKTRDVNHEKVQRNCLSKVMKTKWK